MTEVLALSPEWPFPLCLVGHMLLGDIKREEAYEASYFASSSSRVDGTSSFTGASG